MLEREFVGFSRFYEEIVLFRASFFCPRFESVWSKRDEQELQVTFCYAGGDEPAQGIEEANLLRRPAESIGLVNHDGAHDVVDDAVSIEFS